MFFPLPLVTLIRTYATVSLGENGTLTAITHWPIRDSTFRRVQLIYAELYRLRRWRWQRQLQRVLTSG
jgi:hypothetical protein